MSGIASTWSAIQGYGLFLYGRSLSATGRYNVEGWEYLEQARQSDRPILWSLWHGQMMPFMAFADRFLNPREFVAVTVGDERGDTLSAFSSRLGGTPVRVDMGGHPFAAGRAVLRVIKAMQEGSQSVIAPDGPDGPAFVPKAGVAFLARKARATLLPVGIWTRQAIHLRRWDRYLLPFPYARIHVVLGRPIQVEREDDQNMLLDRISHALHEARTSAQLRAGVQPWR